jgi:hypothetical protein
VEGEEAVWEGLEGGGGEGGWGEGGGVLGYLVG